MPSITNLHLTELGAMFTGVNMLGLWAEHYCANQPRILRIQAASSLDWPDWVSAELLLLSTRIRLRPMAVRLLS
jgi:hypothetical protein